MFNSVNISAKETGRLHAETTGEGEFKIKELQWF